jgi:hypothetical protein
MVKNVKNVERVMKKIGFRRLGLSCNPTGEKRDGKGTFLHNCDRPFIPYF